MRDGYFLEKIRTYYESIKEDFKKELIKKMEIKRDKYPYRGKWLTLNQIRNLQKVVRKKDRIILTEIILLFIFILISTLFLLRFFKIFFLPR